MLRPRLYLPRRAVAGPTALAKLTRLYTPALPSRLPAASRLACPPSTVVSSSSSGSAARSNVHARRQPTNKLATATLTVHTSKNTDTTQEPVGGGCAAAAIATLPPHHHHCRATESRTSSAAAVVQRFSDVFVSSLVLSSARQAPPAGPVSGVFERAVSSTRLCSGTSSGRPSLAGLVSLCERAVTDILWLEALCVERVTGRKTYNNNSTRYGASFKAVGKTGCGGVCSGYTSLLNMASPTSTKPIQRHLSTTPATNKSINKSKKGNFIYKFLTQEIRGSGFRYRGQGIKRTWQEDTSSFTEKTGSVKSRNYSYVRDQKMIFNRSGRFYGRICDRLIKNQQIAERLPLLRNVPDSLNVMYVLGVGFLMYLAAFWFYTEMMDFDFRKEAKPDKEWRAYIEEVHHETRFSGAGQFIYTYLPLRALSRLWGTINEREWPGVTTLLQKGFIWWFDLNMAEAAVQDLSKYPTMQSLFRRRLQPDARPLHPTSTFVSPCDGRVLSFGRLDDTTQMIEQVKGVDYSLKALLGRNKDYQSSECTELKDLTEKEYRQSFMKDPENNDLYYAVIYLAPGDYHRFHSPADWNVKSRRHFPGDLFSVNPAVAKWLPNLFVLNERVVLFGEWEHGFMSYTAVGATMVGSIKIYFDEEVMTSKPYALSGCHKHTGHYFDKHYPQAVPLTRGEQVGEFNMGSTVITVFEAPKEGFEWTFKEPTERVWLNTTLNSLFDMSDDELNQKIEPPAPSIEPETETAGDHPQGYVTRLGRLIFG